MPLGRTENGEAVLNETNFPAGDIEEAEADWIFEIPNVFPFRGTTFITKSWANEKAANPALIGLPQQSKTSLSEAIARSQKDDELKNISLGSILELLPEPLLLALATTSTDENDLVHLAKMSCEFFYTSNTGHPAGLRYQTSHRNKPAPVIKNPELFEAVANNHYLPDAYKQVMVLRPGVQGGSEILGEWSDDTHQSHIFEYLRRNSYLPWGHFAANMSHNSVRYSIDSLSSNDLLGLRHLYYQRSYVRLAEQLNISINYSRQALSEADIENLRLEIAKEIKAPANEHSVFFDSTLWGWNFGFDYAPTHYRLHASHQQVHQQFALIPTRIPATKLVEPGATKDSDDFAPYNYGDLVTEFIAEYYRQTGKQFFDNYIRAIRANKRMDGRRDRENSLIVFEDENVLLFVPKAQTSQWELNLLTLDPIGNILEATSSVRKSIDQGILMAVKALTGLGAKMITSIELSKRFCSSEANQRLMYAFLPRLPESPGAFSEAQLRWINGHYPEDFANVCRQKLATMNLGDLS